MRVAHGIFLWQEPRDVLEPCLRSTAGVIDELIIAEGLIDGVPDLGLGPHSDLSWLAEPLPWLPARIPISSHGAWPGIAPWPTLSAACSWILGKAQELEIDWLLYIDADQELHNGHALRDWLTVCPGEALPITRQEPGGRMLAPWQCIRVNAFKRYLAGTYILERQDGSTANLVPPGSGWQTHVLAGAPWISHHPERRPPWRRNQRLGEFETVLEPPAEIVYAPAR